MYDSAEVSLCVYMRKEVSERGKGKGESAWRAQKEDRKCGACNGVARGRMGKEETVETVVFRVCYLIKLLLI